MRPENKAILWLVIWAVCFSMAFAQAYTTEPTGDSFVRGMNRVGIFLAWQMGALIAAIVAVVVSRGVSKEDFPILRRAGLVPAGIMGLGVMTIVVGVLYFSFAVTEPPAPSTRPQTEAVPG